MNRLDAIFARRGRECGLVIPYVCGGDPDLATTHSVIAALGRAGAKIVEIGIPFSDPVGDGATIVAASRRALDAGTTLALILDLCAGLCGDPAIVLFGYFNPIAKYGVARFAAHARRAGVSGVIVADLSFEEAALLADPLHECGIALILLVSPTTPFERAVRIAQASDGFVYVVSRLGVTGAACKPDIERLAARLRGLRERTARPLVAGFGLSCAGQVARVSPYADGVVVGSALIDTLEGRVGADAACAAVAFYEPLLAAANLDSSTLMRSTSVR